MSEKLALIIGNSEYDDGDLARLTMPDSDVNALADVLRDPQVGGFDKVIALINQPSTTIRREIANFFEGRGRDDLLLLYFSGHGIRDDRGQLFLAVKDTEHKLLRGTAIPANYITEEMDNSRSRRQVLILDCCHSGAFSQGMKAAPGASVGTAAVFEGTGSGRVVLTATDSTQYAWEGDQVIGQAENSVFTHHLVKGLRTGEADTDADGQITLDELYNYVYEQVVYETPKQTPGKWSYGQQGEIVIARNTHPVVKAVELPTELRQTIEDPRPWVREGAVQELDRILRGSNPGLSLTAYEALKHLADDDSRRVASKASESLALFGDAQQLKTSPEPDIRSMLSEPSEQIGHAIEQAKVEQIPQDNMTQVSLPREPAKQEQLTRESIEVAKPVESRGATITQQEANGSTIIRSLIPVEMSWSMVWVTTISWTILWALGWVISESANWSGSVYNIAWPVIGAVGGLITGLTLQRVEPSIQWKHILVIALGWTVGLSIGGAISTALYGNDDATINGIVRGAIGGVIIGLALKWANPSYQWKSILVITLGWTAGHAIDQYFGPALYNAFGQALAGTATWWVFREVILDYSAYNAIGQGIVGSIGLVAIAGAFIRVISGAISSDFLSNAIVLTSSAPVILWAIPGAIFGAIAASIGSIIMFRQVAQVRRQDSLKTVTTTR